MKLMYICGAYRASCLLKTGMNIDRAEQMGKTLLLKKKGWFPLIPHNNTRLWDFDRQLSTVDAEVYLVGTLELMRRCDAVLTLPSYKASKGSLAEIEEAKRLGIPVYYTLDEVPEHG